jgi:hypothetical protein
MAALMPKKLQDFLDKLSRPSKNSFLEQDRPVRLIDRTKARQSSDVAAMQAPPFTFLFLQKDLIGLCPVCSVLTLSRSSTAALRTGRLGILPDGKNQKWPTASGLAKPRGFGLPACETFCR